ncbi:hypothetical protein D9M68_905000 [compost metagenome]
MTVTRSDLLENFRDLWPIFNQKKEVNVRKAGKAQRKMKAEVTKTERSNAKNFALSCNEVIEKLLTLSLAIRDVVHGSGTLRREHVIDSTERLFDESTAV